MSALVSNPEVPKFQLIMDWSILSWNIQTFESQLNISYVMNVYLQINIENILNALLTTRDYT